MKQNEFPSRNNLEGLNSTPTENISHAYDVFSQFGLKPDDQGFLRGELDHSNLDNLSDWRERNSDRGIEMMTPEIFDCKTLLAVSLWRQREGSKINYLLGKGAGVEIALRGIAVGRQKRNLPFPYRTHSDFELYGVDYDENGSIEDRRVGTDEFFHVFGGQEYYPKTKTKGLCNLPPDLLHRTAQFVQFGNIEVLVPELELLFLDKLVRPESTPREEGSDAELLAYTYVLDPKKLHDYAEEFIVKPALEKIDKDSELILRIQLSAITRLLQARRKRSQDEGNEEDIAGIINQLNQDFVNTPMERREMGVKSKYLLPLTNDVLDADLQIIDTNYIDKLKDHIQIIIRREIDQCGSVHELIDRVLEQANSLEKLK